MEPVNPMSPGIEPKASEEAAGCVTTSGMRRVNMKFYQIFIKKSDFAVTNKCKHMLLILIFFNLTLNKNKLIMFKNHHYLNALV